MTLVSKSKNIMYPVVVVALALGTDVLRGMDMLASASVSTGSMESESALNFEANYVLMLGNSHGFQIEGIYSSIGTTEFAGGGAQIFWKYDSQWLASLGYAHINGEFVNSNEISTDLQFQQEWYSIGAKIGFADVNYKNQVPFIDDHANGLLMSIYADFYASDTLRASFGVEHRFDLLFAKFEVEWLTPIEGLSLFVNCMVGENQYDHALVGLRYTFGSERGSLKGLRAIPHALSSATLHGIGNHGALYNSRASKFLAANQGTGFSGGSGQYGGVVNVTNPPNFNLPGVIGPGSSSNLSGSGFMGGGNITPGTTPLSPGHSP